jgi:hypothetical protein
VRGRILVDQGHVRGADGSLAARMRAAGAALASWAEARLQ